MKLFWGCIAIFVWRLLVMLPASAVDRMYRTEAYLAGIVVATIVILGIHGRFFDGTLSPKKHPRFWFLLVLCAGFGFGIIGKELRNIGLSIANETIPLLTTTPADGSPLLAAILASLVYPACFVLMFCRTIAEPIYRAPNIWPAVFITVIVGSLGVPLPLVAKVIFVLGLPVWLYLKTRSQTLAILSYLPGNSLPLINALGINPGIVGFDIDDPIKVVLQPIWFNGLGAFLIAIGLFPILNSPADEDEESQ